MGGTLIRLRFTVIIVQTLAPNYVIATKCEQQFLGYFSFLFVQWKLMVIGHASTVYSCLKFV